MLKLARLSKLAAQGEFINSLATPFKPSVLGAVYTQELFQKQTFNFAGRPKQPKHLKLVGKEQKRGLSDARIAEEEEESKKRKQEQETIVAAQRAKDKLVPLKTQLSHFDIQLTPQRIAMMKEMRKTRKELTFYEEEEEVEPLEEIQKAEESKRTLDLTLNTMPRKETPSLKKKVIHEYYNTEDLVNKDFYSQLTPVQPDLKSVRTGLLAVKMGMTATWNRWGQRLALTVLQVDRCQVIQCRKNAKKGLSSLQIGIGLKNMKKVKKPEIGHYMKAGVPPKVELYEFKVTPENELPVGFQLSPRHFTPGQYVDVLGKCSGKGFQGGMKRWNFAGGNATHGNSLSHRSIGSTGMNQDPGRVFKNKKMPGRMGGVNTIQRSLQVYKIDVPRSLIFVRGAVQGKKGTILRVRDAEKKSIENEEFLNFPTFIPQPNTVYAQEIIMAPSVNDPMENFYHENDTIDVEGND